ncbi:chymotrypsin-1-like [Camponotus floridanus]|uniref:chymotrypsin-1-like n=1 Tax=Camponotus floridanus TaxID=104421 RepID=UPI00059D448A|nr:chymotrypsin-1-like [Camponotus floridanus]
MLPLALFLFIGVLAEQTFADEPEAIVGGTPAGLGEFPHQVSLQSSPYYSSHFCGGSIIAPNKVLTAAHCVESGSTFYVRTGSVDHAKGELHYVKQVYIHPNYSGKQKDAWRCDAAVVVLTKAIQYNSYQRPIPLADSPPATGTVCTLSGWGKTSTNGAVSPNLLKMQQAVISQAQCQQRHWGMPLDSSHLCTLNRQGIGACQGDSGGPLICNGKQYGITSWVVPCAVGEPDCYANVGAPIVRSFIQSIP